MSLSFKSSVKNKIPQSQNRKFSQKQSNLRNVLSPIENIRKCGQSSIKSGKTYIFPPSVKNIDCKENPDSSIFSPAGGNSLQKSKKPVNHGCVTILDFLKKDHKLQPLSKVVPQKKLVLNSYQQQCHVARWKSWLADTPDWILRMGLESANAKISQNAKKGEKENHICENESRNSSYVTIEEETCSNGSVESEDENDVISDEIKTWRDWSIQLSDNEKLFITGKSDDGVHQAEDVTSCQLVDSNTLKFRNGAVYELVGMPDHFTNLPYYIRNKFQCGFPSDWKTVKELWIKYIKEGSPFDFSWSADTNESPLNITFDCNSSLEVPKRRSLIPVKLPIEKSPHFKLSTVAQTQRSTSLEQFKYSPAESERYKSMGSRVVEKRGDHLPTEILMEYKKLDINNSSNNSSPTGSESKVITSTEPQTKNYNKTKKMQMDQEIVLCNWTPVLVNNTSIKIKGYITGSDVPHETDIMEVRKSFSTFRCVNGGSYKLQGRLVDPENSIPDEIKKKLTKGLPARWKLMIDKWCFELEKGLPN